MLERAQTLAGRHAARAAVADIAPDAAVYARLTMGDDDVTAWRVDDALLWSGAGPWGPVVCALGSPSTCLALARAVLDAGAVVRPRWVHLPRTATSDVAAHLTVTAQDDWDFRWVAAAVPAHPAESRVVRLHDADLPAVEALLADAFPSTTTRPGDPRVLGWYGIRSGDALVAVGADRSRGGVGFLAGLTVATDRRGEGLGTALTTAMTRSLGARYGDVGLGVIADNLAASRLYARLGFTATLTRSSVAPACGLPKASSLNGVGHGQAG
ncbi:hypothetical protein GCM10009682_53880 [Luedemannella flava]|uniref:N-acetyltransferase domain-containing protein n=1 Tax=Luedemannella flava TaxID=349316 RepID=A0ABP4YVQ1_9ACTN